MSRIQIEIVQTEVGLELIPGSFERKILVLDIRNHYSLHDMIKISAHVKKLHVQ